MFYPGNLFKENWNTLITIVLVFTCIVTPAQIAFNINETDNDDAQPWDIVNYIVDFTFFLDIIFTFNSAFNDDDFRLIDDRKTIARKYLKGWFTIDFFAIFQFEFIFKSATASKGPNVNSMVRVARIGRTFKLVKLTRLLRVLKMVK